jgi:hypothetical protein
MTTQGGATNWSIDQFYVVETAAGAEAPAEIIPVSTDFDVKVDFSGVGGGWAALEIAGAEYTVDFYAEGIGLAAPEIDLGHESGNLAVGGAPYTVTHTVAGGLATPGVYRLACLIEISPHSGVVGFEENLLISVHAV